MKSKNKRSRVGSSYSNRRADESGVGELGVRHQGPALPLSIFPSSSAPIVMHHQISTANDADVLV